MKISAHVGYVGKQADGLAAALGTALEAIGRRPAPHLDCLTGRPFAHLCDPVDSRRWLTPSVTPWEGLQRALDALSLAESTRLLPASDGGAGDLIGEALGDWLREGPVLVGPLDRDRLWGRLETRHGPEGAHFLVVVARADGGRFLAHDPEGCPLLPISPDRLRAAAEGRGVTWGFAQVGTDGPPRAWAEVRAKALRAGLAIRAATTLDLRAGASGLEALSRSLRTRVPRATDLARLAFALPELGVMRSKLAGFLAEAAPSGEVRGILERVVRVCGSAAAALGDRDIDRLSRALDRLASLERRFDGRLARISLAEET